MMEQTKRYAVLLGLLALALVWLVLSLGRGKDRPNVVLISMDTLRRDHLEVYGYRRPTGPNIRELADRGVVFDAAVSQAPWTLPAHMTLFTGLYPSVHGLVDFSMDPETWRALPRHVPVLAEILRQEGYETAAFTGGGFVGPAFGFDRGFDTFRSASRRLERFYPEVLDWLRRNREEEFFLFVHFYNTHRPYSPPEPFRSRFADPDLAPGSIRGFCEQAEASGSPPSEERLTDIVSMYDGEIAFADSLLGGIFREMRQLGLEEESLIIFLSDHGEEFFEHGNCDHIKSLYDPLIRVPLIVAGPGIPERQRIANTVELRDVPQLVLDYVGVDRDLGPAPRHLLSELAADSTEMRSPAGFSETCCRGYDLEDGVWHHRPSPWIEGALSLRTDRFKLISDQRGRPREFYDLVEDPGETDNLLEREEIRKEVMATVRKLRSEMLQRLLTMDDRRQELGIENQQLALDAETLEQLRALGYVD